ncbi:MAG: hypothetical protein AB1679_34210 [Actinomycetota bacterium]
MFSAYTIVAGLLAAALAGSAVGKFTRVAGTLGALGVPPSWFPYRGPWRPAASAWSPGSSSHRSGSPPG